MVIVYCLYIPVTYIVCLSKPFNMCGRICRNTTKPFNRLRDVTQLLTSRYLLTPQILVSSSSTDVAMCTAYLGQTHTSFFSIFD